MISIAERLAGEAPVILDGAISTELERRGVPMSADAWSGATTLTHPDVLREVHVDYIRAGAEVITTNTYAAARYHLEAAGLGERWREANEQATRIAIEARNSAATSDVWIAGSLSLMPPGLRAANRPPPDLVAAALRDQAEVLADSGCDLLVLEMLRDVDYSARAMDAALATGLPVWAGFSVVPGESGLPMTHPGIESIPFDHCLRSVTGRGEQLVGVMHSEIDDTVSGLQTAAACCAAPLGAWPNVGGIEPPRWQFVDLDPDVFAERAVAWLDDRVRVIGGCCGTSPEHIRALAERIGKAAS